MVEATWGNSEALVTAMEEGQARLRRTQEGKETSYKKKKIKAKTYQKIQFYEKVTRRVENGRKDVNIWAGMAL